jgi:hypothetical protein
MTSLDQGPGYATGQACAPHPACKESIVQWYGLQESGACGYCDCKRPGQRVSAGLSPPSLSHQCQHATLDRGLFVSAY